MNEELGLRERKKRETWHLLMTTALDLFEERGFDNVSVAEVADKAGVSKATVFNYFDTKEDLVVAGAKSHIHEPADLVRGRAPGETPHSVMRDYFLRGLQEREPMSGLCDHPMVLQVQRILRENPALGLRAMEYRRQSASLLAEVLIEEGSSEMTAHLVASQLLHVQHLLSQSNVRRVWAGEPLDDIYPDAVASATHAFQILADGIGDFMRREPDGKIDAAFHHERFSAREQAERALREAAVRQTEDDILEKLADPEHLASHRSSDAHGGDRH